MNTASILSIDAARTIARTQIAAAIEEGRSWTLGSESSDRMLSAIPVLEWDDAMMVESLYRLDSEEANDVESALKTEDYDFEDNYTETSFGDKVRKGHDESNMTRFSDDSLRLTTNGYNEVYGDDSYLSDHGMKIENGWVVAA